MLRSLFFGAEQSQSDSRGVSLSCAVLKQKIVEPYSLVAAIKSAVDETAAGDLEATVKMDGFARARAWSCISDRLPAEYRVTGVESFVIGPNGIVYEKDLGPETLKTFETMDRLNPDKTWNPTDDQWPEEEEAATQ